MHWVPLSITDRNRIYRAERGDDDWADVITNMFNDDDGDPSAPAAGSAKQSGSIHIKYYYARTVFARGTFSPYLESRIRSRRMEAVKGLPSSLFPSVIFRR